MTVIPNSEYNAALDDARLLGTGYLRFEHTLATGNITATRVDPTTIVEIGRDDSAREEPTTRGS